MYAPFSEVDISVSKMYGTPSMLHADSAIYDFWCRDLFQRCASVFNWTVPEAWEGMAKNFFEFLLFSTGYVAIIKDDDLGYIFQPCALGPGRNVLYQPTNIIVMNPYSKELSRTYDLGKDAALLQLTKDFRGIFDIVSYYAVKLANLYVSSNMSIINLKQPHIYAARNRAGANALKKMEDKINRGETLVIIDQVLRFDTSAGTDAIFDLSPKDLKAQYITHDLLEDEDKLIKQFMESIGVPTIPEKKERMLVSEVETQTTASVPKAAVWLDTLNSSLEIIKKTFPDIDLSVELRYNTDMNEEGSGKEELDNANAVSDNAERS